MNNRSILNIVLLCIVLVLIFIVVFQSGEQDEEASLTELHSSDINEISISLPYKESVVLVREAAGWKITEPIEARANPLRIEMLLQLAAARSYARYPAQSLELKHYQLAPPLGSIRFNQQSLFFGGVEALNRRRYVLSGESVQLIAERYFYQTMVTLPALLDPAILPFDAELNRIELPSYSVTHSDEGVWTMDDSELPLIDDVNAFVKNWQQAKAARITPYNNNDVANGLIKASLSDGRLLEFELLQTHPELILGRRDLAMRYHFEAQQGLLGLSGK